MNCAVSRLTIFCAACGLLLCLGIGTISPARCFADGPKALPPSHKLDHPRQAAQEHGPDAQNLIQAAREYVATRPVYRSAYHHGGYPPDGEGVCTDVIWAALKGMGYDLKKNMDADIRSRPSAYPRVRTPDANIDFRRVPNQLVFFRRHTESLSTAYDEACFAPGHQPRHRAPCSAGLWLPGDIVTFQGPDHIAIISDKTNKDGVPYLLHNQGPWATEGDDFAFWASRGITGHFRIFPALGPALNR